MRQTFDESTDPSFGPRHVPLIRQAMKAQGLDGFLVPHEDEHQNEYLPAANDRLAWASGFTGSAGAAVILQDRAAVFVDGRYTLQVRDQVEERLFGYENVPATSVAKWLGENAPEGGKIEADKTGAFTLLAKDATTWSEAMRYEPKPEKNCLGFWTSADDFAEWEFEVAKSGRYQVTVTHGCGGGNHGSEVEVKLAGKSLKFKTQDTGGFQKWSDVAIGEIEISKAGLQRLVIDPVNKVKAAILDVQKITLTPAG